MREGHPWRRASLPWLVASGLAVSLTLACGGTKSERIVVTGSSTVAPLMVEIGQRFEERTGVRVDVQTGGSSRGISDARQGLADIGMVSRALTKKEDDLRGFTLARDGVTLIVHRDNPVPELTPEQVVEVFTGAATEWSAVGCADPDACGKITVVSKAEGRSTLEVFLRHFTLISQDIDASVIIGDNEQGIKTVAGSPGAVGYVSIGAAEVSVAAGVPIRMLPLGGVEASTETLRRGEFPLARELNLVTGGEPTGRVLELIELARSSEVHDLVEAMAFVPVDG